MNNNDIISELNRRDFLAGGSFATVMALMGGIPLHGAEEKSVLNPDGSTTYKGEAVPVKVGIIGCGLWAREILKTIALLPNGPVVAICDTYPAYIKRAGDLAPKAQKYSDYKQLLADKNVEAVIVATPSYQHKEIVIEALTAGKHVYCEAPMANSLEDARAIAAAAKAHPKLNFQVGLQSRADKQIYKLYEWRIKPGVIGKTVKARMQFNKKMSWRLTSPNPEREIEINWRLNKKTSLGLVGEIGIHQIDIANWYLGLQPIAITGFGSVMLWKDGRDVADSVEALIEYPGGIFVNYTSTIDNSFEAEFNVFYGNEGAIMMRERKAWLFKEADAPVLGWEVYSKPEEFYREKGLILGAGATKQESRAVDRFAPADAKTALEYALESFLLNAHNLHAAVEDFNAAYDPDDAAAFTEYLKDQAKNREPAAGWKEGLEATATVIKANEAITDGRKIELKKEFFEI